MRAAYRTSLVALVTWSISASLGLTAPTSEDPCAVTTVSACFEKVFFYAVKPNASTKPEEVAEDCKREEEAIKCAERFANGGCMKGGLLIGTFKILFEGASNEHSMKCEVGHPKNKAYYEHVPCINKVGKKLGDCMRAASSILEAAATQTPLTSRVPYTCCSMIEYRGCIQRTIASACSESHVNYANSIIQGIAGELESTICAQYKEKQCSALPKLKLQKAKYTTLVPSMLEAFRPLG